MHTAAQDFPWTVELEKTVINSLVTSFGLDFLLFKDQKGGDVNTIHNVRHGVWATTDEQLCYEQREDYNSGLYHEHANYIATGERDKAKQSAGTLHDPYRNTMMGANEQRNLDHVISANEIHNDPGRVLAGLNGVELANQSSNLQTTLETVNKSKKDSSINQYLQRLPGLINEHETQLAKDRARLATLQRGTPEQQHKARELEDTIRKTEIKVSKLKSVDPDAMRKRDAEARAPYEQQINHTYYTSRKFLHQTASAAGKAGLAMGTRQMLGMVMAEVWFELREQLPALLTKLKVNFSFETFVGSITASLKGIWERVKARFNAFLVAFKDGVFSGILGSLTTTVFNILATTHVMAIKIIRETWGVLVKGIKLLAFNPDKLSFVELCRAVTSLLSVGAATTVGSMAYAQLLPICSFPFGAELSAFASALITGTITLGLNYFLLHSSVACKLWAFVESMGPHAGTLKQFQTINAELDRYLAELSQLEFNLDVEELQTFTLELQSCNDELERSVVLQQQVLARGIELPFEMGNAASTRNWLASKV
ncbi:hypothetical protein ACK33D_21185 [Aeromonas hydrophila]|uniref:hypothetical protein n=1 Tax=Aeromonas hydrophila TaxID=644 RepID=UPI00049367C8|nr:hypothetical protein [Aeromonas hydrophila]MBM0513910.1 hypothetical protein [Aeromonas hydrophila]MBW3774040.1 hypothetical protein [Aeromonas hydrophila]HAT1545318.1 hypothetical protein [Aeromonas hydrophila]HAT1556499.1 hypothetical protein [Aeromonas hydrophila]